jgi:hypothetical protein
MNAFEEARPDAEMYGNGVLLLIVNISYEPGRHAGTDSSSCTETVSDKNPAAS